MKYILVDAISSYRMRYAVAVPDELSDKEAKEWAQDSVVMEETREFSQEWLGEQISSTRITDKEDLLKTFDEDNDYLKKWSEDLKMKCVLVIDKDGLIVSGKNES